MLTQVPPDQIVRKPANAMRRRVVLNTSLGTLGLGVASWLIYPKVAVFMIGGVGALGMGLVANLALVFGSLMFLREAQRARGLTRSRPDGEP